MTTLSSKVTIFEGPDGAGKTTAIQKFIAQTGGVYVHHGAYPDEENIAHHYLESLRPAMFGEHDVVMDRSWFDEKPYGQAFRFGKDRIGHMGVEIFKEIMKMCGGLVVVCLPPWQNVEANYLSRRAQEYLTHIEQLRHVYDYFAVTADIYPLTYPYDYTQDLDLNPEALDRCRTYRSEMRDTAAFYLMLKCLIKEADTHAVLDSD